MLGAAAAPPPHVYSLIICNRDGSLIYSLDLSERVQLCVNERIILASTLHGISRIAAQLMPTSLIPKQQLGFLQPQGITEIDTTEFRLHVFETPTGLKFLVVASLGLTQATAQALLREVYGHYSDYTLKDPFNERDQPVRSEALQLQLRTVFDKYLDGTKRLTLFHE